MTDWRDEMCEIAYCELCDETGLRLNGLHRCDHVDYGAIAKRGIEKCRRAREEAKK